MVHCTGCDCGFTASGYTSHVNFTSNSACRAAYFQEIDALQGASEDFEGHSDSELDGTGPHISPFCDSDGFINDISPFHDSDGFINDNYFEVSTCK